MKYWRSVSFIAMAALIAGLLISPVMAQSPPQLRDGSVNLASGDSSTDFYYEVSYYDLDGDLPVVSEVHIDGVPYQMDLHSGLPANGVYRFGPRNLAIGTHDYFFYFDDGQDGIARLPEQDSFPGPTVNPTYAENNPGVATGLASLQGKLVMAYGYMLGEGNGGWTFYSPAVPPQTNTLVTLHERRGYWINVNQNCNLAYGSRVYPLQAGWNLIGWVGW